MNRIYTDSKTGSGRRMWRTQLWLQACLAFVSLIPLADGVPLKLMTAPNLLRVGTTENIFVECQDCSGEDIKVEISLLNHPTKSKRLATTSVTLHTSNNFQQFGKITIPTAYFNKDPNMKQYVYLQAQFPDQLLQKVVLVSLQSGHIFIQTDNNLYTPNSNVLYRIFALTPNMEPVEDVSIPTPQNSVFVYRPGLWKVVAKFHRNPQQSYSAEFEVKEYVPPSFEVKLSPESSFFCVDTSELIVEIKATYYLFGEEVDGTAYGVFGLMREGQKKSFPRSLQSVKVSTTFSLLIIFSYNILFYNLAFTSCLRFPIFPSVCSLLHFLTFPSADIKYF
uniref:Uncharacterized protein n=1 Tax=Anabas testudineus TaxID=64144 RepID=A0A3Q1HQQ5_ANATE